VKKIVMRGMLFVLAPVFISTGVLAATSDSTNFTQQIGSGTLSTYIGDATGAEVANPSVAFTAKAVSSSMQTSTGTLGTSSQRIYVDNPGGANNGWTVTLAATGGPTAKWTSGSNQYSYNALLPTDGQLSINPSIATISNEVGALTGLTIGTLGTFLSDVTSSITLITAGAGSDDINRVYITGINLIQTIPGGTPAGTYTIDFTETATAS
jgi:hypothetical protein